MHRLVQFCRRFRRARRGATAIEYGFLVALISIALLSVITFLGESVVALFGGVSSDVEAAVPFTGDGGGVEGNCGDGQGAGQAECENK